jgi:hypothetical protein
MTIVSNNRKSIELSFPEEVKEIKGKHFDRKYEVELPKLVCSEEEDAIYIQTRINSIVNQLAHDLVK